MKNIDYNLISRYLVGETDNNENFQIEEWKNASAKNKELLVEFERLLQNASPKQPPFIPDINTAWLEIESKIRSSDNARILPFKGPRTIPSATFNRFRAYTVAAIFVLITGAVLLYRNPPFSGKLQKSQTQNAQRLHLSLPDGSKVRLNSDSNIQYPRVFTDSVRTVYLSGEAFFDVQPQTIPFLVKTENAEIRVLGTSFNIWARDKQTRVVVKEGRVTFNSLQNLDKGVILNANQMSYCGKDEIPSEPTEVDLNKSLGWLENRIIFERTPLHEIIAELSRYYDVKILLEEPEFGQHTLTGSFHSQPIDTVLASICLTLNLHYKVKNNEYLIWAPK